MQRMVQIFIMTHNRSSLLANSIDSVLKQQMTNCEYEIIISDNSTNTETEQLIKEHYSNASNLIYRKRSPMPWTQHFNTVLSEVTLSYFMIFHDDDTMHPNMVESLYNEMQNDSKLLAVGCNAKLFKDNKILRNFFDKSSDVDIKNVDQLAIAYLNHCHAPFPCYMYRKFVSESVQLDLRKGGKYCDVSFLLDIAGQGRIKMLKEPLMNYYYHGNQISTIHECEQHDSLIRYLLRVSSFTKESDLIKKYRINNFYAKISGFEKPISSNRWFKIRNIFFIYSPFFLFPRIVIKRILKLV